MIDRHKHILQTLAANQNASVTDLSRSCNVSEVTIRSDLKYLAKAGKIERVHGGARLIEERMRQEYNYQTRKSLNAEKKIKIGRMAASLVGPQESILLDSSTTSVAMAQALNDRKDSQDITIITTGIWTAIELMATPNINVLLTGGYVRHTTGSIAGIPAENMLNNLNIHKAFLGAWGVSHSSGFSDNHLLEVELKRYIVQRTDDIFILADSSKFDRSGLAAYANVEQGTTIITDSSVTTNQIKEFKSKGVEVLVAE